MRIKHTKVAPVGLAGQIWPISNTPIVSASAAAAVATVVASCAVARDARWHYNGSLGRPKKLIKLTRMTFHVINFGEEN
jgi:hypothetical protein